jgi:hypothetical protein
MKPYAALLLAALAAAPAAAAEAPAKALAPFLDDRTVAVLHVNLAAVDVDALAARLAAAGRIDVKELAAPKKGLSAFLKALTGAGVKELYVVASLIDVPDRPPFVVLRLGKGADVKALTERLRRPRLFNVTNFEKVGGALVGADPATCKRLRSLKPVPRPEVGQALAAAGGVARLVVVPTTDTARVLEEVMPTLPDEVGGGSVKPLSRGLRWAALALDAPPNLAVRLTVQTPDAASAKALHALLVRAAKALRGHELSRAVPDFDKLLELVMPRVEGDRLTRALDEKALLPVLKPYLTLALEAAERERASKELARILVALHDYHGDHRQFPASASYDKGNKPLLSWRVHLLPYLGEKDLYKQFKLDEPWDSAQNKKLIARMPAVYRPAAAGLAAAHKTTYLAPVGGETMFPGPRGLRIVDVTDGTSNTIFLVDAADDEAVVWTRPHDLKYDPKAPAKGLAPRHRARYMVGAVDGAVHFLPKDTPKETLQALFTACGGEVVDWP